MKNDNGLEYIPVGRIKLTDRTLDEITRHVEEKYGVKVLGITETKEGYVFKGKYGFTIGDIIYNPYAESYGSFNFHNGVKESIAARDRAKEAKRQAENKRRFALQKGAKIGLSLTLAGTLVLASLGVIKYFNNKKNSLPETNSPTIAAEVDHLNTVKSANDLILLSWANYAMGGVSEKCLDSEYVGVQAIKDDVYANIFVPIMTDYYVYIDKLDSELPRDIVGERIDKSHASFRNKVADFDSYLTENFNNLTFASSPYADAIVMDEMDQVITSTSPLQGELLDNEGKAITIDDNARIYIRLASIEGHEYTLDNLPEDAIIYNGEAYVLEGHLYNDLTQKMNK